LLGVLVSLPVLAVDYHHSRTDGEQIVGTSVGQQSSNQAFNIFDSLLDAASASFALFWMGDLQEQGGNTMGTALMPTPEPFWGDYPPTQALQDNRPQDDDVDWATWSVVTTKALLSGPAQPPRPLFTPNVPQAWSPVELDMDDGSRGPDHFLLGVSFEPVTVGAVANTREQVLNAYYPQTGAGLPGNDPNNTTGPMGRQRGTVAPFWRRTTGLPGLRIRDLEPIRTSLSTTNPGVGVVTQAPILARVPAIYSANGSTVSEVLPVVYLVVGTGENGDYARVICVSLKQPASQKPNNPTADEDAYWLPNASATTGSTILNPIEPPDPDNFDPDDGSGGAVMWSYRVEDSAGNPAPVAGISFANIGTSADSRPLLFVTTTSLDPITSAPIDGEVICLNAKAADKEITSVDGDPLAGEERWSFRNPTFTPTSTGVPFRPGFHYGMSPAVCRVPLTSAFRGQSGDESEFTAGRAISNHNVSEWMVFVADTAGIFRSFEAPGEPQKTGMKLTSHTALPRWTDSPVNALNQPEFRLDRTPAQNPERFLVPPVVYQGNTPLRTDNGALVAGSTDVGFDDEVIFASEKGTIYCLDTIGRFVVNRSSAANDGTPTGATDTRWTWPDNDTAMSTDPLVNPNEPRVWPRELPSPNAGTWADRSLGPEVPLNTEYFCRSPLAVTLGANTNPNGFSPNLDVGDDLIFVPYMQEQLPTATGPPVQRRFYEYVGSLKPYGFVQASRPISRLDKVEVTLGGNLVEIPLDHLRVGTVKTNGISSTESNTILAPSSDAGQPNPNYQPGITVEDTIYVVGPTWYDDGDQQYYTLPSSGVQLTIEYQAPTDTTNPALQTVTETIDYPSCYRLTYPNLADFTVTQILRSRASLGVDYNRLEQRRISRNQMTGIATVTDEDPALVDETLFNTHGWRPGAMMASGSSSTNGTLMVPSWYRGRVIAMTNRLRAIRMILGCYDPRIDPAVRQAYGATNPVADVNGDYGPTWRAAHYDPGVFYQGSVKDYPLISDAGCSVALVDGWAYIMYRNGHIRAFSNVGGGAAGTQYYPPIYYPPAPPNNGNMVRAPVGIYLTNDPNNPADRTAYRGFDATGNPVAGQLDRSLMVEMGETLNVVVDFGEGPVVAPQSIDPHEIGNDIDAQVLQYDVQAQLRSSNGAVQQLPGVNRGVRPVRVTPATGNPRIMAVVQVFTGLPSATNPLTPGTPLLWEKDPSSAVPGADFTGEVTFDLQVTQQGVQWRWPGPPDPGNPGFYVTDPNKQHFWEGERNGQYPPAPAAATRQNVRYPTTGGKDAGGNPLWNWGNEWAPLLTYNNPLAMYYDPDPRASGANIFGIHVPSAMGSGSAVNDIGLVESYAQRLAPGRKNGDTYVVDTVGSQSSGVSDGARSGHGMPIIPLIGVAQNTSGSGPVAQQILFGVHGGSSPITTNNYPNAAKVYVADRSHVGLTGRALSVRVQRAPLTKMGAGAWLATLGDTSLRNGAEAGVPVAYPQGSFQQNRLYWDDGPHQAYSSIPESRVLVTKDGTSLDLSSSPITIPGRVAGRNVNGFFTSGVPSTLATEMEALAVQVDIPRYTADDIYSTRWRTSGPNGANPGFTGTTFQGSAGSAFCPLFPSPVGTIPSRPFWDLAESYSRAQQGAQQPSEPLVNSPFQDPKPSSATVPGYDDRLRRVVIYNDANNNGQLDVLPTYREAYRTFAVQVAVKPDLKVEASQQVLDLGAMWHGKKQPGLAGGGANEIREWQQMNLMSASPSPANNIAAFYRQYWRQFVLQNAGNVNLAFMKPELAFQSPTAGLQLVGLPSEGNDPWRALSLLAGLTPVGGGPNPQTDPYQIFLRTSFDDQLLPDTSSAYGLGQRGIWLQKAAAGSSQPGSVAYAEITASGNAALRDPSNRNGANQPTAEPRETWLTLNIPTGAALGQYSGSIRFFNDRTVAFAEPLTQAITPGMPAGFAYGRPNLAQDGSGTLERDATGEPIEPATDPPVRVKAKITENLVHGRYQVASGPKDPQDRRMMPAAVADASAVSASGTVQRIILAYAGNRNGLPMGQPALYDLFGTNLTFDTGRYLFPYDELPLDRAPWADLPNAGFGWSALTSLPVGSKISRPSAVQDPSGVGVLAWTEQQTLGAGSDIYRVLYQSLNGGATIALQPGGQPPDPKLQRSGVKLASVPGNWLAFYAAGPNGRRGLVYSTVATANLGNGNAWSPELPLATSSALTSVNDPSVAITEAQPRQPAPLPNDPNQPAHIQAENTTLPQMAAVAYVGSNPRQGRSDIYFSRYRIPALTAASAKGSTNQQARDQEYAQVSFPRTEGDILKGDTARLLYISGGVDFLIPDRSLGIIPTVGPGPVQLYLARPDVPLASPAITAGRNGSLVAPLPLIAAGQSALGETPQGELVFSLNPALITGASIPVKQGVRIMVDRTGGTFRLSMDARRLANLILPTPAMTSASPDPVLTADYTAATMRITRGTVSASDPVIVPVLSQVGQTPVTDASWYLQQVDSWRSPQNQTKWELGYPVAGIADRLWVFWRNTTGATAAGPTSFYKVLRPGIRVRAGQISALGFTVSGGAPIQEVNPALGLIFLPLTWEGQRVTVTYAGPGGGYTEEHVVSWQDETGERPVPMENSVNEGSLDAFVSYEDANMTAPGSIAPVSARKMERMWLFWSSTRNSGGDIYYASVAPRIGPDVNVQGSVNYSASSAAAPAALSRLSPTNARTVAQQFSVYERRHPFVVPRLTRRGPYLPTRATAYRAPRK